MEKVRNCRLKKKPFWFTFFRQGKIWLLRIFVLQRRAKKCTKNYNAHAPQLTVLLIESLLSDVAVAVAVVVSLNSLLLV